MRTYREHPSGFQNDILGREGERLELHLAGFDLGKIENIVDDGQKRLGRRLDRLQIVPLLGIEFGIERQLGHADDAVHRRTDFMAHVSQERAARLVRRLGGFLGGDQRRLGILDRTDVAQQDQHADRLASRVARRDRTAYQQPAPLAVAGPHPALGLKIAFLALRVRRNPELQFAQVFRMQQFLPLGNRVFQGVDRVAEQFLPVPPRFDDAAAQIPVGQRIAGKERLPVIETGIGAVG